MERAPRPAPEEASAARPVAELLQSLASLEAPLHPLADYAQAFKEFPEKATRLIHAGADSVVLELEGDRVLKITRGERNPEHGTRPFDIPVLDAGTFRVERGEDFPTEGYYLIQPKADTAVSFEETQQFIADLRRQGYRDIDIGYHGQQQLGRYQGKLFLLDYKAVGRSAPTMGKQPG